MTVIFDDNIYKGMLPREDAHNLPPGFAQTASNAKLIRGILQAWKSPATVQATTTGINAIRRYTVNASGAQTVNWLTWSGNVQSVVNTVPGDTKQTVVWVDPANGELRHSRNDKLVFTGNYVKDTTDYFKLGVPAPTLAPQITISGTDPTPGTIKTYAYCWVYRNQMGALSATFSVELQRNQNAYIFGMDTAAPVSGTGGKSKETNWKKYLFVVDTETSQYMLVAKLDYSADDYTDDTGKVIKTYKASSFKVSTAAAPAGPVNVGYSDCTTTTSWTAGTGWTHGASEFTHGGGNAGDLSFALTGLTIGVQYVVYATTANQTTGNLTIKLDTTALKSSIQTNMLQIVRFTATATGHSIVFSADATCNASVNDIRVTTDTIGVITSATTADSVSGRSYLYCFIYVQGGVNKRGDASSAASIAGIDASAPVILSGMASSSGLSSTIKNVRKAIFRADTANPPVYRLVAVVPESQTSYTDATPTKKLGKAITYWTLASAGSPATPTVALKTSDDTGIGKVSRYYFYTYVTAWGEESAPSPLSLLAEVLPWEAVTLTTGTTAPTGYTNVTLKRFYRTDVNGNYRVVFAEDVPIATASIDDHTLDADLGEVCPTITWLTPPTGVKALSKLPNGVLCAVFNNYTSVTGGNIADDGNQIGFSEPGFPYAWPLVNQFTLDYPVVGVAVCSNGVVIGTQGVPYVCQGSDPASMVPQRIEQQQACLSASSMVEMGDYVIYASPDGLVGVTGSEAMLLTDGTITRDQWQAYVIKADGSTATLRAVQYERRYLLFYDLGTSQGALLFDPTDKSLSAIALATAPSAVFNDLATDSLYLQIGTNVQKWDAGSALTYTYRSLRVLLNRAINPADGRVDASAYPVTFKLYADGTLVHTQTVADSRAFRLPGGYRAFAFEYEVTGTADIRRTTIATTMAELA